MFSLSLNWKRVIEGISCANNATVNRTVSTLLEHADAVGIVAEIGDVFLVDGDRGL